MATALPGLADSGGSCSGVQGLRACTKKSSANKVRELVDGQARGCGPAVPTWPPSSLPGTLEEA